MKRAYFIIKKTKVNLSSLNKLKIVRIDGKPLCNSNNDLRVLFFSYSIIKPIKQQEIHTFRDTGNFLNNFELYINPNLTQVVEIFSTGTGTCRKGLFRG
jgi:hypothetical protein